MEESRLIIAIDGLSGAGKSTLGSNLSTYLAIPYLNTGAIYRSLALNILRDKISLTDINAIVSRAKALQQISANRDIYTEAVSKVASVIAAIPLVRQALLTIQRNFTQNSRGAILDGRDIGEIICPHAQYKFFLTAAIHIRAMRRIQELQRLHQRVMYKQVLYSIKKRDLYDSLRKTAPLKKSTEHLLIDTSYLSPHRTLHRVINSISLCKIS